MPKCRTDRSLSFRRPRASPYPSGSKNADKYNKSKETQLKPVEFEKEWEEARCSVCMEHPHNAVLLSCSSRQKGCRPYMCDTSYRHSNCLDQFIKSTPDTSLSVNHMPNTAFHNGAQSLTLFRGRKLLTKLVCPLCRGEIDGWEVIEPARRFMNSKQRSCSMETCNFSGNYSVLREHARLEHPTVRPSEVDPGRQRDWTRLERERDFEDVLSAYQLPSGDLLSEDILLHELRGLEDAISAITTEPEDELIEDYGSLVDFELELPFTFINPLFTAEHFETLGFGGSIIVDSVPSNNPLAFWQRSPRSNRSQQRRSRPIN